MKGKVIHRGKSGAGGVVKMQQPKADSELARRMVEAEGEDALALLKTFQCHFGAKLVWWEDAQGEVGKKPGWVDEPEQGAPVTQRKGWVHD